MKKIWHNWDLDNEEECSYDKVEDWKDWNNEKDYDIDEEDEDDNEDEYDIDEEDEDDNEDEY